MPWTRLLPGPTADLDDDELRHSYHHPGPPAGRRAWVRANMISSLDGAATDAGGRTEGLSSPADRQLLVLLRRAADVVLVGAGTVRAQRYRPSRTLVAVLTRTGDLDPTIPMFDPDADGPRERIRPLVLATPTASADRLRALAGGAEIVRVQAAVTDAVGVLASRGLTRILTEGGPRLLADLTAVGELDELCLTLAGRLVGSDSPRILDGPALGHPPTGHPTTGGADFEPVSILRCERDLYLRSRLVRPPADDTTALNSGA